MACRCEQSGLGALPPVHQEAFFSLGVEIDVVCETASGCIWTSSNEREIEAALNESDYASGVSVWQLSGFFNPFIVIEGYSALEYGSADDLRRAVLSVIRGKGYLYNPGSVRFEAETYDPSTGQTSRIRYDAPSGGGASGAPTIQPDQPKPSWFDQIGLDLGIKKSEAQLFIFGGIALLAVLLAKR